MTGIHEQLEQNPAALRLSKSRIAAFEQCRRRLWLQVHLPQAAATKQDSAKERLKSGAKVGAVARALVPNGALVKADPNVQAALDQTADLIASADQPIFEATLEHDGVLVRMDILKPVSVDGEQAWELIEVKDSTSCKLYHISDVATQLWVAENSGLKIANASVRHLNSGFVLKDLGNYGHLFKDAELYDDAKAIALDRHSVVREARTVLGGDQPALSTGAHCSTPSDCEFVAYCKGLEPEPPEWPIAELPNTGKRLAGTWSEQKVYDLRELPEEAPLNALHQRIRCAVVSRQPYADNTAFAEAISKWAFPRTWLDFETISFAIPRWIGTRPWQAVPFQFSAHVETSDGTINHVEALDLTGNDPRPMMAQALAMLPNEGAVIAWNKSYEASVLRVLAQAVPVHKVALLSLVERLVDPMPLAKAHYYHPDQRGSFSIKYVLPTIAPELDYQALEVSDGIAAQAAYLEAISSECTEERRAQIDIALRLYCGQDTWAMVVICERLSATRRS